MKTNILDPKRHSRTGPGGWKCACCGPAPSHRKEFAKKHRKRIYRMLDRLLNKELAV